jgi:GNAT superfamily N-acetyltransferase
VSGAVDDERPAEIAGGAVRPVGSVTTDIDEAPAVFDRPDRLVVDDIYVREPYRRAGLARELMTYATDRARAVGCPELAFDVDADNPQVVALDEKWGSNRSGNGRRFRPTHSDAEPPAVPEGDRSHQSNSAWSRRPASFRTGPTTSVVPSRMSAELTGGSRPVNSLSSSPATL